MYKKILVMLFVVSLALTGCGGASQASVDRLATQVAGIPTQQPYPTAMPTATPLNLAQLATMIAPTPIPPTATPVLTATIAALQTQVAMGPVTGTPLAGVTGTPVVNATPNSTPSTAITLTPLAITTTGNWQIAYYDGVTDQMRGWGRDLKNLVTDWSKYPNVDFTKYNFKAKDGVEYGMAESAYCQRSQTCDVNVPAMHYRLITGDYNIPGIDECSFDNGAGCGIALFNVGNVTAMYRESHVDYGFTVEGRYWNGDAMATTIHALMSNTAFNMLNQSGGVNAGANCSVPGGCGKVRLTVVIISGNQLLMKATTTVSK